MSAWLNWLGASAPDEVVNDRTPEPHRSELLVGHARAAALWAERSSPFNRAFALASAREGAAIIEELGAHEHARATLRGVGVQPGGTGKLASADPDALTGRQMDVLRCLAEGKSNAQVGETLFISSKTVDHHVSAILAKLGAANRGEAVAKARVSGLL